MGNENELSEVRAAIRVVPDFPEPGVIFQDLTPVLADARLFGQLLDALAARALERRAEVLVCPESRGFIFGAALASRLRLGFVPVRKPGKLPGRILRVRYDMEYGPGGGELQLSADALREGERALIVDDVLATGGTAAACAELVVRAGAKVVGALFVLEIPALQGRAKLNAMGVVESLLREPVSSLAK
jgi:adenine phosphoribosyltransferase